MPRIYHKKLLETTHEHPIKREPWKYDQLRKMTIPPEKEGGFSARKKTARHKGRSYVVRTGPKGGSYILVNTIKIYV